MSADPVLLDATSCVTTADALTWIAEDLPLAPKVSPQKILESVLQVAGDDTTRQAAISRLARLAAASGIDTAAIILESESAVRPDQIREALDALTRRSASGTLEGLDARSFFHAQRENVLCTETLCAVAGVTYPELRRRSPVPLPSSSLGPLTVTQSEAVVSIIDELIQGTEQPQLPGAIAVRPLELLAGADVESSWSTVDSMIRSGVSYETLLAQRIVGGSWARHRSQTSSKLGAVLVALVGTELDSRSVTYLVSSEQGGTASQSAIRELVGALSDVSLVALTPEGAPGFAVVVSVANDGGTARKNARSLRLIGKLSVPAGIVVAGIGWSGRNETSELVEVFGAHIYTETSVGALADHIEAATKGDR